MASMSSAAASSRAAPRSSKKKSDVSSAASSQSGAGSRSTASSGTAGKRMIWPKAALSIVHAWEEEYAIQGTGGKRYHPQVTLKAVRKIKSELLGALLTNPKNDWARNIEDEKLQVKVKSYMKNRWKLDPLPLPQKKFQIKWCY